MYANGGIFTITITVEDDDGGSDSTNFDVLITGAGVNNGVLQVVGTDSTDIISINYIRNRVQVIADLGEDLGKDDFIKIRLRLRRNTVTSIRVLACDDDDWIFVNQQATVPAILDGGGGNDEIQGGNGESILEGGPGDDILSAGDVAGSTVNGGEGEDYLTGSNGADILSGGGGNDTIYGSRGNDLLDGGDDTDYCFPGPGADTVVNCEPQPPKDF